MQGVSGGSILPVFLLSGIVCWELRADSVPWSLRICEVRASPFFDAFKLLMLALIPYVDTDETRKHRTAVIIVVMLLSV